MVYTDYRFASNVHIPWGRSFLIGPSGKKYVKHDHTWPPELRKQKLKEFLKGEIPLCKSQVERDVIREILNGI